MTDEDQAAAVQQWFEQTYGFRADPARAIQAYQQAYRGNYGNAAPRDVRRPPVGLGLAGNYAPLEQQRAQGRQAQASFGGGGTSAAINYEALSRSNPQAAGAIYAQGLAPQIGGGAAANTYGNYQAGMNRKNNAAGFNMQLTQPLANPALGFRSYNPSAGQYQAVGGQPRFAGPSGASAGYGSPGGGGGGAGGSSGWLGNSAPGAVGQAVEGSVIRGMGSQGFDPQERAGMYSRQADIMSGARRSQDEETRRSYGARGLGGSDLEAAALRESGQRYTSNLAASDRDLSVAGAQTARAERRAATGQGLGYLDLLRSERGDRRSDLAQMLQLVYGGM